MKRDVVRWATMLAATGILLMHTAVMAATGPTPGGEVPKPRISPPAGKYQVSGEPFLVEISCSVTNALIRYTVDGTAPTIGSTPYTGPLSIPADAVTSDVTIKAVAYARGMRGSIMAEARYEFVDRTSGPILDPPGGICSAESLTVRISSTEGDSVRYTLDGRNPIATSPIAVSNILYLSEISATLKVRAFRGAEPVGPIASGSFTVFRNVPLQHNVPIGDRSGNAGSEQYYVCTIVPPKFLLLFCTTNGLGDCDLYVNYGSRPTTSTYWSASCKAGTVESAYVLTNVPGSWYIMLYGKSSYSNVTIRSVVSGP